MKRIFCLLVAIIMSISAVSALAYEELAKGSKGEEVVRLQKRLNILGYSVGNADGDFGGKTEAAVKAFQRDHKIEETGIADSATMELITKQSDVLYSLESIYNVQDTMSFHIPKSGAKTINMMVGATVLPGGMEQYTSFKDVSNELQMNVTEDTFPYGWVAFQNDGSMTICYRAKDMSGAAVCKSTFHSGGGVFLAAIIEACAENNIEECCTFVNLDNGEVHYWQPPSGLIMNGIVGYESLGSFCSMMKEIG